SFRFNYLAWHPIIDVLETAIDLGQQLQCTLSRAQLMCAKLRGLIVNIKHGAQRGTFGQQPLGIPRRKVLKGLLVMFGPDWNSGPVSEQIQNPIKAAQKTTQLIARRFDLDGSGVNGHEPPGEETAATYRKICADEAE